MGHGTLSQVNSIIIQWGDGMYITSMRGYSIHEFVWVVVCTVGASGVWIMYVCVGLSSVLVT